jgi:hypothetical protein
MKIADIKGMNNAFWMNTGNQPATGDYFEIDVSELQYPNYEPSQRSRKNQPFGRY